MFKHEILIENQSDFVVLSIRNAAGSWIKGRVSHCQNAGQEALKILKKLNVPRGDLDDQWELQVQTLTQTKQGE